MNNKRRQQLKVWISKAMVLKSELEAIGSEEEFTYDNMPENLQGTTNAMNSEDAIEKINDAVECVEEAICSVEEIF